jgi:hypothetical protein
MASAGKCQLCLRRIYLPNACSTLANTRVRRKSLSPMISSAPARTVRQNFITRIPQLKSERGASLEQQVLASTRNFRSQIADSILEFEICHNLPFAIPKGMSSLRKVCSLLMTSPSTAESGLLTGKCVMGSLMQAWYKLLEAGFSPG